MPQLHTQQRLCRLLTCQQAALCASCRCSSRHGLWQSSGKCAAGGQYDCGTTDVTRTFHLGTPTDHQRLCWTRVLQVRTANIPQLVSSDWAQVTTSPTELQLSWQTALSCCAQAGKAPHFPACRGT